MSSRWTERLPDVRAALARGVLHLFWRALVRQGGGEVLTLGPDPSAPTYWTRREEPLQPRERYHLPY